MNITGYKDKREFRGRCNIDVYLMDYKEAMDQDIFFDIAICDPPYFEGPNKLGYYRNGRTSKTGVKSNDYRKDIEEWEVPGQNYFDWITSISVNQIVWGINYYNIKNPGNGRIAWDKCNDKSTFSDMEFAWCSKLKHIKKFTYMWNGMMQGKSIKEGHIMQGDKSKNEKRIHATQKPVNLYKWLLINFAENCYSLLGSSKKFSCI